MPKRTKAPVLIDAIKAEEREPIIRRRKTRAYNRYYIVSRGLLRYIGIAVVVVLGTYLLTAATTAIMNDRPFVDVLQELLNKTAAVFSKN